MEMISFWGMHIRRYIPWMFVPDILSIKFEELINDRMKTLDKICSFWRWPGFGSPEAMQDRIESVKPPTFRKGVIGDWKNHFNEDHIRAFQKELGSVLELMGYEN